MAKLLVTFMPIQLGDHYRLIGLEITRAVPGSWYNTLVQFTGSHVILDRDYAGLTEPLDYQQVCPLLFLWVEKAVVQALGFREWSLRLVPTAAAVAGLFVFRHVAGRLFRLVAFL